jgi:hypothetical protein
VLNISVFPNPAVKTVTLKTGQVIKGDLVMTIYTAMGALVRSDLLKQDQRQIDIEELNNGIYIVEVKSREASVYQKLIIQK